MRSRCLGSDAPVFSSAFAQAPRIRVNIPISSCNFSREAVMLACNEDMRQLRGIMDAMAPIVAQSYELRRRQPELGVPLDLYKSHLSELQSTLEQIRVTRLVRQASLRASQSHLQAVAQWTTAFSQTRQNKLVKNRQQLLPEKARGYPRARFFTCLASFSACSAFFMKVTDRTALGSAVWYSFCSSEAS